MNKTERIKAEKLRLCAIFWELPRQDFYTILGLIDTAAFLKITLDDLAEQINKNGVVEEYSNGRGQGGQKISSELKAYEKLCASYERIIRRLADKVPHTRQYTNNRASENEILAFRRFREQEEIEFYLSDDFAQRLEESKNKALELMAQGK